MAERFAPVWQNVGQITVTANTNGPVDVGNYELREDSDSLFVRVTQVGGGTPFRHAYGILSWRNEDGNALGSCKAYGKGEPEVYKLGGGLQPLQRQGTITFQPRHYNLSWIEATGTNWTLRFDAASGEAHGGGEADALAAVAAALINPNAEGVQFEDAEGDLIRVVF